MNDRSIARALLFALTLAAPLGANPDGETQGAVYVWTGKRGNIGRAPRIGVETTFYGSSDVGETRRAPPDAHANALRAELAALRIEEATAGPSAEFEARRVDLWIRACDEAGFAGQGELLVELALDRAESLAERGETESALAATQELLIPARLAAQAGELDLRAADAAWLERAAAWLADPALVTWRLKLVPAQGSQTASQDVETVIRKHLADGNRQAVLQFGLRAVPVIEEFIDAYPAAYPADGDADPLTILFELSEERGARFAIQRLAGPSELFPLRVLRSMREARVLMDADTWSFSTVEVDRVSVERPHLRERVWLEVVELLAHQRVTALDVLNEIALLVYMDSLTPGLTEFVEASVRGDDEDLSQRALNALNDGGGRAGIRPLLERLLDSDRAEVREFVAYRLAQFEVVPALWARAKDPSTGVRSAILGGLRTDGYYGVRIYGVNQSQGRGPIPSLRGLDRGGMSALEALLADANPEIYVAAAELLLKALAEHPELTPAPDSLRTLTDHGDFRLRELLPRMGPRGRPDPLVLERLAGDSRVEVVDAVDGALNKLATAGPLPTADRPLEPGWSVLEFVSTPWSDDYLPALLKRLGNPARDVGQVIGAVQFAVRTPMGAESLVARALELGSRSFSASLVDVLSRSAPWGGGASPWRLIEPKAAHDLLELGWKQLDQPATINDTAARMLTGTKGLDAAGYAWLGEADLPWSVRLLGARLSAQSPDETWRARWIGLLSAPDAAQVAGIVDLSAVLQRTGLAVTDARVAGHVLADVVNQPKIAVELAAPFVQGLATRALIDSQTAIGVLERWGNFRNQFDEVLLLAARAVDLGDEDPRVALFESLLRGPDDDVREGIFQAIGRMRLRAHMPLLERALLGELAPTHGALSLHQALAASTLACYLDDEAAEILLRGIGGTTEASVRDACFAALDTIRRFQDERARWSSRADAGRARAEAIAELIGLIESGDAAQKVEAARALGTLEAVEELPRLVRLAGSRDAALAKAAKEALERIHATGGKD